MKIKEKIEIANEIKKEFEIQKKDVLEFESFSNSKEKTLLKELNSEEIKQPLNFSDNNLNQSPKETKVIDQFVKPKNKTRLVTISTTDEVIKMEEELKKYYEENGNVITFKRSILYKVGLTKILKDIREEEKKRKEYEKK